MIWWLLIVALIVGGAVWAGYRVMGTKPTEPRPEAQGEKTGEPHRAESRPRSP